MTSHQYSPNRECNNCDRRRHDFQIHRHRRQRSTLRAYHKFVQNCAAYQQTLFNLQNYLSQLVDQTQQLVNQAHYVYFLNLR